MTGYVHVYTGNGKGKTTAALGLAVRAAGAGMTVFIAQFVKGMKYSEIEPLRKLSEFITLKQYGRDCFIHKKPQEEDIQAARTGLEEVKQIVRDCKCDMLILDEATIAIYFNLFNQNELLDIIDARPQNMEIIITGRYADQELIDKADLVTEMREIKHYFQKGVQARAGIEK